MGLLEPHVETHLASSLFLSTSLFCRSSTLSLARVCSRVLATLAASVYSNTGHGLTKQCHLSHLADFKGGSLPVMPALIIAGAQSTGMSHNRFCWFPGQPLCCSFQGRVSSSYYFLCFLLAVFACMQLAAP